MIDSLTWCNWKTSFFFQSDKEATIRKQKGKFKELDIEFQGNIRCTNIQLCFQVLNDVQYMVTIIGVLMRDLLFSVPIVTEYLDWLQR